MHQSLESSSNLVPSLELVGHYVPIGLEQKGGKNCQTHTLMTSVVSVLGRILTFSGGPQHPQLPRPKDQLLNISG